jgi:hypothetical protein
MAKIEVLKGQQQTSVGPIGIVSMGKGGVAAGQAIANAGQRIFDAAFEYAYNAEKDKGEEEARLAAISARDTDGNLVFPEMPKSLSVVAQKYYEPIANKRYTDALLLDIDSFAQKTAANHERDPEGFAKEFQVFLDTTRDASGKYAGVVESAGAIASKQYQTKLFTDQVEFDDKLAAQNGVVKLNKMMADITSSATNGATGTARQLLTNGQEELQGFSVEHGDRVGMAFLPETEKKFRYAFVSGDIINISNKLAVSLGGDDPFASQAKLSAALNYMAMSVENGSLEGVPPAIREQLEKAGFKEKYINDDVFAGLHSQIAREIRTRQGTVQEQFNAEKNDRLTGAAVTDLANGFNLSKANADLVSNAIGIRTSVDLSNNLNLIMNPPTDKAQKIQWEERFGAFHNMAFESTGELPTVIQDYLTNVDTLTADQLPVAIAMYQQATTFNRGTYSEKLSRGLNDETVVMWETLSNVQDVLGTSALPEFMNSFREKDTASADEVKANIFRKLGKDKGTVASAVREFVTDNIRSDASPDEITFYTRFADDLLYSMDKPRVQKILQSAGDAVFRKSDLLHSSIGRSRFTPERAYTDDASMTDFKVSAQTKLELVGRNYELGRNAFLVPDPREGSALPVYTLVDIDKNIITYNGKPLQVGNGYVLEQMAKRRNVTIAQLRVDAANSRELYTRNQKIFDAQKDISYP